MENINSWKDIHWSAIEKNVFRLQFRIYKAAVNQEFKKMYKIQKLLLSSQSAKYFSVKRVTHNNQGLIKILTIKDRSKQMLVYLALCPQWEAEFEAENYMFRPKRSKLDAIDATFFEIYRNPKWVLNAEILKSFDQINHKYLLEKCNTFPELSQKIQVYLKSGILDDKKYIFSEQYTPLSCLLLNIVLHRLGKRIEAYIKSVNGQCFSLKIIYHINNFIFLYPDQKVLKSIKKIILKFLESIGVELNLKKMQLTHTLTPGFTFFGFNLFHQTKWVKVEKRIKNYYANLQFISIITLSKKSLKKHKLQIREIIQYYRGASQERLIQKLNPVILNWGLSKPIQLSSKTFQSLDQFVFLHLWKWVKSRHPMMSNYRLKKKYWHHVGMKNWVFGVKIKSEILFQLQLYSKIPIRLIRLSEE